MKRFHPEILAYLHDVLFKNLPDHKAKEWPIKFINAIPLGADLTKVWPQFAMFLLIRPPYGILQYAKTKEQKQIIQNLANLYTEKYLGKRTITKEEWKIEAKKTEHVLDLDAELKVTYHIDNVCYGVAVFYTTDTEIYAIRAANTIKDAAYANDFDCYDRGIFSRLSSDYYEFLSDKLIELLVTSGDK